MSLFAYLTPTRQLRLVEDGKDRALSGEIGGVSFSNWSLPTAESHSWPTFSPENTHIASFSLPQEREDSAPRLIVNSTDGITSEELASLDGRLPIYLQWAEDGQRLGVLTQEKERLVLSSVRRGELGNEDRLLEGSPMFFTWWGDRIAVFSAGAPAAVAPSTRYRLSRAELVLLGADGMTKLPRVPGNFCAPVAVGNQLAYVARNPDAQSLGDRLPQLLLSGPDGTLQALQPIDGLAAMVRSPDGRHLAVATAEGESAPYRNLSLTDLKTGQVRNISDTPCMAFFWSQDGRVLIRASVDTTNNALRWEAVDLEGEATLLIEVHPTRDITFYLRFFEQYCQSHPLVSPDGKNLLVTGAKRGSAGAPPKVWQVPVHGGPPEEIGEGTFAVYGW